VAKAKLIRLDAGGICKPTAGNYTRVDSRSSRFRRFSSTCPCCGSFWMYGSAHNQLSELPNSCVHEYPHALSRVTRRLDHALKRRIRCRTPWKARELCCPESPKSQATNGIQIQSPSTPVTVRVPSSLVHDVDTITVALSRGDTDKCAHTDNWHFFGTQYITDDFPSSLVSVGASTKPHSTYSNAEPRPPLKAHKSSNSETRIPTPSTPTERRTRRVVARVSTHVLRLEREFQLAKHVVSQSDPDFQHFVRPIELVRLPPRQGREALVVSIFEAPGTNYLRELVELGPNSYRGLSNRVNGDVPAASIKSGGQIPLLLFLDFAVGASQCLEILHHGNRIVHGELRGDAFHLNQQTGGVKMLNFGSGARAFENGLTSAGWYSLSREIGVEHKLQFIAPEQTGRLPAEPDSRTDIYSLGILFWMMLTGEQAFEGETPLIIMQNVLSRRIPSLASKRMDIPEVLSAVVQKMTQKNIDDRYNSTSGLRYDLVQIRQMLCEGDGEGLKAFQICTKDVSAFFNLPASQIGRVKEKKRLVGIIEDVARRRQKVSSVSGSRLYQMGSSSASSDNPMVMEDVTSDSTSSKGSESRVGNGTPVQGSRHQSQENTGESESSSTQEKLSLAKQRGVDPRSSSSLSSTQNSNTFDSTAKFLRDATRTIKKGRCEVVSIFGYVHHSLNKSCALFVEQL
jgi:serine/threonine protein kinase